MAGFNGFRNFAAAHGGALAILYSDSQDLTTGTDSFSVLSFCGCLPPRAPPPSRTPISPPHAPCLPRSEPSQLRATSCLAAATHALLPSAIDAFAVPSAPVPAAVVAVSEHMQNFYNFPRRWGLPFPRAKNGTGSNMGRHFCCGPPTHQTGPYTNAV